jgi:inward rectifier potassium channel
MAVNNNADNTFRKEDIGLDRSGQKGRQRTISSEGNYNVQRIHSNSLGNFHLYYWLITTTWRKYWISVFLFYFFANVVFALIYFLLGVENLNGIKGDTAIDHLLYCFFFSTQSFTTVGYGGIYPISKAASSIAAIEAFIGITTFAIVTGTLYGRFSKATSKIKYSNNLIVAPYKTSKALMFMIANEQATNLIELEAKVNYSWIEKDGNESLRRFDILKLEVEKINMFPTSWTIVHHINETSVLFGKTLKEIQQSEAEILVMIKGFDETYSQTIYSKHSYTGDEMVWGAKFTRPFYINENGKLTLDLNKVGNYEPAEIV